MNFKPFDIFSCQPPGWNEPHPCVIISNADRADRKSPVEVLLCSSQRANRPPAPGEVLLDKADGLDWPTICKCEPIVSMLRESFKSRRGEVSRERRAHLVRKVIAAHGWGAVLAA